MTPLRGVRGDEGIAPYGWFIEARLCNGWNTEKPRRDHRDRGGVGTPERIRAAGLPLRRSPRWAFLTPYKSPKILDFTGFSGISLLVNSRLKPANFSWFFAFLLAGY